MTPLIITHYIICGVCIALGLFHLMVFLKRPERRADLFFFIMALCTAMSVFFETQSYHVETVAAYVVVHKAQTVFLGIVWITLVWFTAAYTGFQRRWLAVTISAAYGVAIVMHLVFPFGVLYGEIDAIQSVILPWGEQISMVSGSPNPWRLIPDVAWILMIYLALESCVRMGRAGDKRRAIFFGTSLFFFLGLSYLHGTLMDFDIVGPPTLHHFFFFGLILVMSGSIQNELVQGSVLKQKIITNEKQWETFLENVTLLVVGFDAQGSINYVNSAFLEKTGFSREEIMGTPSFELVPESDREEVRERIRTAAAGGVRPSVVRTILAKDGSEMQIKWSNVVMRDWNDQVTGIFGLGEDITALQGAERALVEEKERTDTILAALDTGLALINPDLTVAWVNAKTLGILSWDDLVGKVCYEAAAKLTEPCEGCGALMAFSDGQVHETNRQSPVDGKWHHIVSVPIKDKNGTVVNVLESVTDITVRKEAEIARDLALEEVKDLKNRLEEENIYLKSEIQEVHFPSDIVGESNVLRYVLSRVHEVAQTDATVLIQGETGTGKELVSRAIHEASGRKDKAFIKVNCAALPASLIESELFGHERGAFTGAHQLRKGRFELAHGGTLFLDEISELPLDLQPKLLRVLQDGEFERVGGTKTLKMDVRVVAATNHHLEQEVDKGFFRADLFYRLNVYPISVPPLRKRKDDIPLLVEHFVPLLSAQVGKHIDQIPQRIMEQFLAYDWPGNVRELKNVLERAVITSPNSVLRLPEGLGQKDEEVPKGIGKKSKLLPLSSVEKDHIVSVLKATGWRISGDKGAAKILGLNPSTLRFRMKKLGIRKE